MTRIRGAVIGGWLAGPAGMAAGADFRTVTLETTYAEFAQNPMTGDLLALDGSPNTATLYPRGLLEAKAGVKAVGPVKLDGKPVQAVFERVKDRPFFRVALADSPNVVVPAAWCRILFRGVRRPETRIELSRHEGRREWPIGTRRWRRRSRNSC